MAADANPRSAASRRAGWIGAITIVVLMTVLVALRGALLRDLTIGIADCPACMGATAIQQDATILALTLAFVGLSFAFQRYWLQLPWLVLGVALVFVYSIDTVLEKTLTQRLYLFDVIKFGKELSAIWVFGDIFLATRAGKVALAVAAVGVVVLVVAMLPRPRSPRLAIGCLIAAGLLAVAGRWQPTTMKYIHYELLQNVIAANLDFGVDKGYSEAFAEKILREYVPPEPVCAPGQGRRPNFIVVAVESLSMHHSKLFGGFRDLTPHLDAIARTHTYFPDFIANGFTTDGGLIAMITGQPPIPVIGRYESTEAFAGFDKPEGALPDLLHPYGYTVHFFTTGDLGFLDKAKWLKSLHFDSWEGAEQPFYNGWKRRHFGAAEDKALYLRLLQWLDQRSDAQAPYLAFLLTVSTHPPFINPETDLPDEEGAFRYADREIGFLYDELERRGFFKNGILLIEGDHRSMTPLLAPEQKRFGESAMARTPLVVATDLPIARGAVQGRFQQADIPSSLADIAGTRSCLTPAQGSLFRNPPQPPAFIAHARGDKRNAIDIYFGGERGEIVMDGDQTRWTGPRPASWRQIMDGILAERIRRGAVEENFLDFIVRLHAPQRETPTGTLAPQRGNAPAPKQGAAGAPAAR